MTGGKPLYTIVSNVKYGNSERMTRRSQQRGFTIVEILITMVVVALLLSLAAPSFSSLVQKRRITSVSEQLASFLVIAQSESVKKNRPVTVSFTRTSATNWCVGRAEGTATCNCTNPVAVDYCQIDGVATVIDGNTLTSVQLSAAADNFGGNSAFIYDPVRGLMANPADSGSFTFLTNNGKFSLQVELSGTGKVDVCNPDGSKKVVGFNAC